MANNKHYFIRRTSGRTGRVDYKRCMCTEGWTTDRSACWQFSRSGAKKIIEYLQAIADRRKNHPYSEHYTYDLVEGTLPYSGRDTNWKE